MISKLQNNCLKLNIFLLMLFFGFFGLAKSSWAACTSSTPDLTTLQACVTSNETQDLRNQTITISSGTANWGTGTLTVTKGVWLRFAGTDGSSTITSNAGAGIQFNPDSISMSDDSTIFKISRLDLVGTLGLAARAVGSDGNTYVSQSYHNTEVPLNAAVTKPVTGSQWNSYWYLACTGVCGGATAWDANTSYPQDSIASGVAGGWSGAFEKVIIIDSKFTNWREGVYPTGNIYGVVANNLYIDVATLGRGLGAGKDSWDNHPFHFGDANQLWFEDNTISFTVDPETAPMTYATSGANTRGWTEGGNGGRLALRYNTYDMTNNTNGNIMRDMHDLHGEAGGWGWGTMGYEMYGNKIYNDNPVNGGPARRWLANRGGQTLMFDNQWNWSGTGGAPWNDVWEEIENQCTWSGGVQTCAYHEYVNNTYYWNNYQNGTDALVTKNMDCCLGNVYGQNNGCCNNGLGNPALMPDKQYWTYHAAESGAQAHGVGCGTLANRPANCTTGVGYWATNQSCTDLTGMVGTNPVTPIVGTLYKCVSTNTWSTPGDGITYTPYKYPHPLRGIIDTTAPAAPRGLSVN